MKPARSPASGFNLESLVGTVGVWGRVVLPGMPQTHMTLGFPARPQQRGGALVIVSARRVFSCLHWPVMMGTIRHETVFHMKGIFTLHHHRRPAKVFPSCSAPLRGSFQPVRTVPILEPLPAAPRSATNPKTYSNPTRNVEESEFCSKLHYHCFTWRSIWTEH